MTPERRRYCALDVAATRAVADALLVRLANGEVPGAQAFYAFERALQAPALAMSLRGMRVDRAKVAIALGECEREASEARAVLTALGCPFTYIRSFAPSPAQVASELRRRGARMRFSRKTGNETTDDDALLALVREGKPNIAPLASAVLALRHLDKDRETLERGVDADGRVRASWNVGATEVDRFSSSTNPMRTGGNMQNVRKALRACYVADPGWVLWQCDLRCADSHFVAYKSADAAYIRVHETPGADSHTLVAQMLWPEEKWPKDPAAAKAFASSHKPAWSAALPLRQHSKRTQHATNFDESASALAGRLGMKEATARAFQARYKRSFPGIPIWQDWCRAQLAERGELRTAFGRTRQFFGRRNDPATQREAIAFEPAHNTAVVCNIGMLRVWGELDLPNGNVQLLANGHDALLGQVREGHEREASERITRALSVRVPVACIDGRSRELTLASELKLGHDWLSVS